MRRFVADLLERHLVELVDNIRDLGLRSPRAAPEWSAVAPASATSPPSPGARPGKSRTPRTRLRSAGSRSAIAHGPRGPPGHRSTSAHPSRSAPDAPVDDLDPEPLRVQVDSHRHRELEGLQVDLRANVRDLADRDAAELDRRAGREPADRFIEDELVGLRIARGGL